MRIANSQVPSARSVIVVGTCHASVRATPPALLGFFSVASHKAAAASQQLGVLRLGPPEGRAVREVLERAARVAACTIAEQGAGKGFRMVGSLCGAACFLLLIAVPTCRPGTCLLTNSSSRGCRPKEPPLRAADGRALGHSGVKGADGRRCQAVCQGAAAVVKTLQSLGMCRG